jgi:hypothetical protein
MLYLLRTTYYFFWLLRCSDATIFEPNNVKNSFVCVTIQHNFDIALASVFSPRHVIKMIA